MSAAAATASSPVRGSRVTQARVLLSEWTKLRSLRSTRYSLLIATVLTIGFSVLFAFITASRWSHMDVRERGNRNPLDIALAGVNVSQLAIGVLGVLVITGEYSTGMIRATLTAVPKRLPVLWAKTAVFAVVAFLLMLPSVLVAFWASQAILRNHHILQLSFSHPGVARAVIGAALYLTVLGVFTLALGAIIRSTAGGISAFAGIFWVLRYSSAQSDSVTGLELSVVAAVLLGGVSIFGGSGGIVGVVAGVLIIRTVNYSLQLAGLPDTVLTIVTGSLLVLSVIAPSVSARIRRSSELRRSRQLVHDASAA